VLVHTEAMKGEGDGRRQKLYHSPAKITFYQPCRSTSIIGLEDELQRNINYQLMQFMAWRSETVFAAFNYRGSLLV
jgi:hypothetical protein